MSFADVPKCTSRKTNGQPCGNIAMRGQTVCRSHGGATKASRAAGLRRVAAGIDVHAPKVGDVPRPDFLDAETAALEVMADLVRLTRFVSLQVETLTAGDLMIKDSEIGLRVAPMVELLRGLLVDANRWTQGAMKLRLEDRRVRIEEERQRWIVGVIVEAMAGTPMPDDARQIMRDKIIIGLRGGRAPSPELTGSGACGTEGGRQKHRERDEPLCDACRLAYNDAQAARARKKADRFTDRPSVELVSAGGGQFSQAQASVEG